MDGQETLAKTVQVQAKCCSSNEAHWKRKVWVEYQWTPIPNTGQIREASLALEDYQRVPPQAAPLPSSDLRPQTTDPTSMTHRRTTKFRSPLASRCHDAPPVSPLHEAVYHPSVLLRGCAFPILFFPALFSRFRIAGIDVFRRFCCCGLDGPFVDDGTASS